MLSLVCKVIQDWRVIVIFIAVAIYLEFVGFIAAYRKSNAVRKMARRPAPVVEAAPPPAESEEEQPEADE